MTLLRQGGRKAVHNRLRISSSTGKIYSRKAGDPTFRTSLRNFTQ